MLTLKKNDFQKQPNFWLLVFPEDLQDLQDEPTFSYIKGKKKKQKIQIIKI